MRQLLGGGSARVGAVLLAGLIGACGGDGDETQTGTGTGTGNAPVSFEDTVRGKDPTLRIDDASVASSLQAQGTTIVQSLATTGITAEWDDEIVAMIAYLQRLGVEGTAYIRSQGGQE